MKTEAEIRNHLRDLKVGLECRQHHDTIQEQLECCYGAMMMQGAIRSLEWALGIDPHADRFVEELSVAVERSRRHG